MTRRFPPVWRLLVLAITLMMVAVACGSDDDSSDDGGNGGGSSEYSSLSGDLPGSGASFPDAAYQAAIAAFTDVAPDLNVTYNSIGSGSGKEEFGANLNDWAGTDSLVDEGDGPEEGSFYYVPTTASSVTAAYNLPDVEELNLDGPVMAKIFQREIKTWNDPAIVALNDGVDLPDTEITVAHRSDGSGTTANFTAYLVAAAPDDWKLGSDDVVEWPADTVGGAQNTGVAQIVEQTDGAIGYVDLGDANILGLQTAAVENQAGNFVKPSVEATTAALANSELSPDLTYDPLFGPGEDSYPITAPTYILVRTTYDSQELVDNIIGWVKWLVNEGIPEVGPELGYAPLPEDFMEQATTQVEKVTTS